MDESANLYVAVVDDDASLCRSLARLLRAAGFHPVTYLSAEAFLADTKRPQFDCLVLDIRLGGMSGIELNEQLASSGSTTPVIYLTANADPELQVAALRSPCAGYLRKTDPGEAVLAAIRKAVRPTAARRERSDRERSGKEGFK